MWRETYNVNFRSGSKNLLFRNAIFKLELK